MVVNASLAQDACVSEREVVIEEISRYDDQPEDQVHELFAASLMPSHPLGLPVIGHRGTVSGFDHDAASRFHQRHYTSGNIVVAASGAVDHQEVVDMVSKQLTFPEGPRTERVHATPVGASSLSVITKDTEQAHIVMGVTGLPARHEDRFVLAALDGVLGGGMASRLFQEIREKRGLAYAVYSYHSHYQDTGDFAVYAGTRPDNAAQVIGLINTEVDRLVNDGATADELDRVRESIKGHMILGLESTRSRMTRLGKVEVTGGELLSLDDIIERLDSITLDDLHRVAQQILTTDRTLAVIAPFAEDAVAHLM